MFAADKRRGKTGSERTPMKATSAKHRRTKCKVTASTTKQVATICTQLC